jgi:PAS domain S-box-containing protein
MSNPVLLDDAAHGETALGLVEGKQPGRFFRQLVDSSLDIIVVVDGRGMIRFENRASQRLLGYRPDERIGRWVFDFVHPDDRPATLKEFERVLAVPGEIGAAEFRYRNKDGSWRHMAVVGRNLLHDPAIAGVIANLRDITEQKQAEMALRESEERFRQLTENIDEVYWMTDPQATEILFVSLAYEDVWGRTCESLIHSPRSFIDAVHPDDRQHLLACLSANASGQPFTAEYRVLRPDGSIRWVLDRGFPVFDEDGSLYRCAGIAKDITDRRAREDDLKKLTMAVEQSPAAVLITDTNGMIEFVNPKFTEMTGYTSAEVVGQNPRFLKSGKHDEAFYRDMWETISKGAVWRGEVCNRKKDGTLYWESASICAVHNERKEIRNFVAVKEDITVKVRDREQMRLQSSALAAAANSIFITDRQGHIQWANAAFCQMTGYSLDELVDRTPRLL